MSDEISINPIDPKVIASGIYKLNKPKTSEWQCFLFCGSPLGGSTHFIYRPAKGQEPNWFWRKMQYLILGNKWVKDPKEASE